MPIDIEKLSSQIFQQWDNSIIPELVEYIRIPNKSPMFDPDWKENGYMDSVVQQFVRWVQQQNVHGLSLEVIQLGQRTPLIYIEIEAFQCDSDKTVLLYGHLDKQPEMSGWREDLSPWKPVIEGDKLYGRGGADDGYALFSCISAIQALQSQQQAHDRCVIIIESCEESGSYDLPPYIDHLQDRIGQPELVVCLDSGCGNYDQLWTTTSLRGLIGGTLTVEVLGEGVHSGDASGIVPSSFRVMRQLLDRLEEVGTGRLLSDDFYVEIPESRIQQSQKAAEQMGDALFHRFPTVDGLQPQSNDVCELILNRSWRPTLSYIGADHIPSIASAGNVLRPKTSLKLSLRLPPGCDAERASQTLARLLTNNPPYGANITFTPDWAAGGWLAPDIEPWLEQAMDEASMAIYQKPAVHMGEGWSIPFMGMLGEKYPNAQFMISGVLGPGSNAHGPNEFLHIPMAKKLTACVALVLARHQQH